MHRFLLLLVALLGSQLCVFADNELDERLKAVMLLFDKKQQQLMDQIGELTLENERLAREVEMLQSKNQALITENRSLRRQVGITPPKSVEIAASPKSLEAIQAYASNLLKSSASSPDLTNVNTASLAELDELPGVGPVIAQRIVDNRPYATVDDLLGVPGIGKTSIEGLRPHVRVR